MNTATQQTDMPQRFLRPGITNSEAWNSVDAMAENFYIRILTRVDDFGRYDARPYVLMGDCWSVWNAKHPSEVVDLESVSKMLAQLSNAGLVDIYEAGGKQVLQITQWGEKIRTGVKERWPKNPNQSPQLAGNCGELHASSSSSSSSSSISTSCEDGVCESVEVKTRFELDAAKIYDAYPRKVGRPKAIFSIAKQLHDYDFNFLLEATIKYAKTWEFAPKEEMQFCPHPTTWFNQQRFNDDPRTWKRYATNSINGKQGFDRNKGTLNEGRAESYDLETLRPNVGVSNNGGPAT